MARTNLRDTLKPDMLAPGTKGKIIQRNTFRFTAPNGDDVIRLHNTDIVRKTPKGKIILDSGGWRTGTTKDRMDSHLPAGYRLIADKGSWYVVRNDSGGPWDSANPRVPYYDGISLPDCFNAAALRKGAAHEARSGRQSILRTRTTGTSRARPISPIGPSPVASGLLAPGMHSSNAGSSGPLPSLLHRRPRRLLFRHSPAGLGRNPGRLK